MIWLPATNGQISLQGLDIPTVHLFLYLSADREINTDALEPLLKVTYKKFAVKKEKVDKIHVFWFSSLLLKANSLRDDHCFVYSSRILEDFHFTQNLCSTSSLSVLFRADILFTVTICLKSCRTNRKINILTYEFFSYYRYWYFFS